MTPALRIATVEREHAEELRDALVEAGIDVELAPVQAMTQVEVVRHQLQPLVDVLVPEAQGPAARKLVERVEAAAEALADQESQRPATYPAADEAGIATAEPSASGPSLGVAVALGIGGLALVSGMVFLADRTFAGAAERYPYGFPVAGMMLFGLVYLALRRRS